MRLERVAALYARVEEMRKGELQRAAAGVAEVEAAAGAERVGLEVRAALGRVAMLAGDRAGWACADAMVGAAEQRLMGLETMQVEREAAAAAAAEVHRESRLKREQMERLVERMRLDAAIVEGRREQAGADDRFASRGAWAKGRMSEG